MSTIGATLVSVEPGSVTVELPCREDLQQQHGFTHAGAVVSVADSACGYAALSLMPAGAGVLSVEFKVNLVAAAVGDRLLAAGRVVKSGRTLEQIPVLPEHDLPPWFVLHQKTVGTV